jgi:hypothetical protein
MAGVREQEEYNTENVSDSPQLGYNGVTISEMNASSDHTGSGRSDLEKADQSGKWQIGVCQCKGVAEKC